MGESIYYLLPGVRVREEGFGLLFYKSSDGMLTFVRRPDLLCTARNGRNALRLASEPGNANSVLRALMARSLLAPVSLPDEDIRHNAVSRAGRSPSGTKERHAYGEPLRAPVNVTWEITSRCNLRCRHCLSADIGDHAGPELDFDQCCRFIDHLHSLGVFQINFGGGEPFLRPDFLDILEYAHKKEITTCVSTNGTTLDDALVERLKRMDLLYLQVSLDGASAATNDRLRGEGTFEKIMAGIQLLSRHTIPGVSTNTVVTGLNFHEIPEICSLGAGYGMKTRLSRFRPSGAAKRAWHELRLNAAQLEGLSDFLSARKEVLTGDSFFSITREDRRALGLTMCGAARMTCSVAPDGGLYPCAFLQEAAFRAGNVGAEPLESIWRDATVFHSVRNVRKKSCEGCVRFDLCHGGCPAVAHFLTQSLETPDPECLVATPEDVRHQPSQGADDYARTV